MIEFHPGVVPSPRRQKVRQLWGSRQTCRTREQPKFMVVRRRVFGSTWEASPNLFRTPDSSWIFSTLTGRNRIKPRSTCFTSQRMDLVRASSIGSKSYRGPAPISSTSPEILQHRGSSWASSRIGKTRRWSSSSCSIRPHRSVA